MIMVVIKSSMSRIGLDMERSSDSESKSMFCTIFLVSDTIATVLNIDLSCET